MFRIEYVRSYSTTLAGNPRAKMVRTRTQFHNHSAEEKRKYVEDILLSKFVLCPRGWFPATYRLFEVMELGRCPVIISDDWVPIDGVPWQDCCLVIRQKDAASCANILGEQESECRENSGKLLEKSGKRIFPMR